MFRNIRKKVAFIIAAIVITTMLPVTSGHNGTVTFVNAATKKTATIKSIADINKTVVVDDEVTMPKTVSAVMSDKTKKKISVKWDKVLNSDIDGTYTAIGTVTGYSKKITYTLIVKAPKLGTIEIPQVTDSTLKKPSDVKLAIAKKTIWEDGKQKEIDESELSVCWTPVSPDVDQYKIVAYNQYNQSVIKSYRYVDPDEITKGKAEFSLSLSKVKNTTISTITITPIITTEEAQTSGDRTKNKTGETAVFECAIKVTVNTENQITMNATKTEYNENAYDISFSMNLAPYTYGELSSYYKYKEFDNYGTARIGTYSDENGVLKFNGMESENEKYAFANTSAKLTLVVYSDAAIESSSKGSYSVTVYPVKYKAGK